MIKTKIWFYLSIGLDILIFFVIKKVIHEYITGLNAFLLIAILLIVAILIALNAFLIGKMLTRRPMIILLIVSILFSVVINFLSDKKSIYPNQSRKYISSNIKC